MIIPRTVLRVRPALRLLAAAALVAAVLAGCSADTASEAASAVEDAGDQAAAEIEGAADELDGSTEDAAAEIDERSAAIARVLRDNNLESLASAVEQVDATEIVGDGQFTLFAPNDEAFLELDADQLADLLSNPTELATVLQNHVVTETIDSSALGGAPEVQTRTGNTLPVTVSGDTVMVGDATVVTADIDAGDGVIHVIDRVLLP